MPTKKQELGEYGELVVVKNCSCPKCKRSKTFKRLPTNFKCADIICDFCGYLAQVKATNVKNLNKVPKSILGAAWGPQKERMKAGIYFSLFIVLVNGHSFSIYYLSADSQTPALFEPRRPLSKKARRAGWQGFTYNLKQVSKKTIIQLK